MKRFAAVINDQGQFAATCVGDFKFIPELGRHAWNGLTAETAEELAEQVNGALKSVIDFGDPFKTLEVIEVGKTAVTETTGNEEIILEANRQLQDVLVAVTPATRKLQVLRT